LFVISVTQLHYYIINKCFCQAYFEFFLKTAKYTNIEQANNEYY